jgi:hypothetical protein
MNVQELHFNPQSKGKNQLKYRVYDKMLEFAVIIGKAVNTTGENPNSPA